MRLGVKAITAVAGGAIAGLASAHVAMDASISSAAPWQDQQSVAASGSPYALARLLLDRKLSSPAPTEFVLERDQDGASLDADCAYRLAGRLPVAMWFSIAAGAAASSAITPDNAVFEPDGSLVVALTREPQAGNVIAPGEVSPFALRLRLYAADGGPVQAAPQLVLEKGTCR